MLLLFVCFFFSALNKIYLQNKTKKTKNKKKSKRKIWFVSNQDVLFICERRILWIFVFIKKIKQGKETGKKKKFIELRIEDQRSPWHFRHWSFDDLDFFLIQQLVLFSIGVCVWVCVCMSRCHLDATFVI